MLWRARLEPNYGHNLECQNTELEFAVEKRFFHEISFSDSQSCTSHFSDRLRGDTYWHTAGSRADEASRRPSSRRQRALQGLQAVREAACVSHDHDRGTKRPAHGPDDC